MPGYIDPVVRKAADGEREFANFNWGGVMRTVQFGAKREDLQTQVSWLTVCAKTMLL